MTSLVGNLQARGLIHDVSHLQELDQLLKGESVVFYCGFDPTASSLHVGSMLPLLLMRRFQKAGHKPIALVGSATGMIGDPSFKSEERVLLTKEQIDENVIGISKQIGLFLNPEGENGFRLVKNGDWLEKFSYIDFLRDVGKFFTINSMIAKDCVRERLENRSQGISYTEFSYLLLQSYDFYWLNRTYNCRLQVGGSDQWGNITAGLEFIRRRSGENHPQAYGLTFPLLTTSSGQKFGKTEKGAVWLDAARTSPYKFYQFWFNSPDADVLRYLALFSEASNEELAEFKSSLENQPEQRLAQKRLAAELTAIVHGEAEVKKAVAANQVLFGGDIKGIGAQTLLEIFSDVPSITLKKSEAEQGLPLQDLLVQAGTAASKGAAKRLVEGGGVYLNSEKLGDSRAIVTLSAFVEDTVLVIRSGKKNYYLIRLA